MGIGLPLTEGQSRKRKDDDAWRRAAATPPGMIDGLLFPLSTIARTDQQLLEEFVSRSDESAEAAFASLVERYSPIVHSVCVDVLGDPHEAQDAAQAVFLVLARKARSIRKPESLGPWLHGVAVRVAQRARSVAGRRRLVERRKAEMMYELRSVSSGPEPMDYFELHEEINRLPQKYRLPIILCYLQGKSQIQAAQALGWPLGTVQIRLHRGKERLRSTLIRRGAGLVPLTSADLTARLSLNTGALDRAWTDSTARAAVRFAAGKSTAGLVAPTVSRLAETVLAAVLADTLKIVVLTAISFLLVVGGIRFIDRSTDKRHLERGQMESEHAPDRVLKPESKNTGAPAGAVVWRPRHQRSDGGHGDRNCRKTTAHRAEHSHYEASDPHDAALERTGQERHRTPEFNAGDGAAAEPGNRSEGVG